MLAVVIPYFKATFFEATLQSLASQTNKRFKVYIYMLQVRKDQLINYKSSEDTLILLYRCFESNL
jgi:hypothetical protein